VAADAEIDLVAELANLLGRLRAKRKCTPCIQGSCFVGLLVDRLRCRSNASEVHKRRRMRLNGVDQLWVADITYIRLQAEFVYLAVILDGYSRKVVVEAGS